jgi:hypothetical protein
MVRNPKAAISKDVVCVSGLTADTRVRAWVSAVGSGGRSLSAGVPVLQPFYEKFPIYEDHLDTELQAVMDRKAIYGVGHTVTEDLPTHITPENRYEFWLATGMTPDEQLVAEIGMEDWSPSLCRSDSDIWPTGVSLLDVTSAA